MTSEVTGVGIALAVATKSVAHSVLIARLGPTRAEAVLVGTVRATFGAGMAYLLVAFATNIPWQVETRLDAIRSMLGLPLLACGLPLLRWAEWYAVLRLIKSDASPHGITRGAGRLVIWSFITDFVVLAVLWLVPAASTIGSMTVSH